MKKNMMILVCMLIPNIGLLAQSEPILKMLEDQVDAFNKRDVTRLVNNVSEDFKWYSITSDTLLLEVAGKKDFKAGMEEYYKYRPEITSKIESYTIDGNRISFKEVVGHKNKDGEMVSSSAMGIYEIRQGKIFRAWYYID